MTKTTEPPNEYKETEDMETIEHTTKSSVVIETDIDPIELLEALDGFIETLGKNPSEDDIKQIESQLKSMEIITMENEGKHWWMNESLVLHQYVMKRPLSKRISHLLKTKGEWKSEHVRKDSLEVKSRVYLPLKIPVKQEAKTALQDGFVHKLALLIMGLRNTIEDMLKDGASTCGVFRKPHSVIHMNRIKMWLEDNENNGLWEMKDDLNTMSLYDITQNAVLTVDS